MRDLKVRSPLIEDIKMDVASKYGIGQPGWSDTQGVRAVFFVDPNGTIQIFMYYPLEVGRNFDEIKHVLQALQKRDADRVALPPAGRFPVHYLAPGP